MWRLAFLNYLLNVQRSGQSKPCVLDDLQLRPLETRVGFFHYLSFGAAHNIDNNNLFRLYSAFLGTQSTLHMEQWKFASVLCFKLLQVLQVIY